MQTVWHIKRTLPSGPGQDVFEMVDSLHLGLMMLLNEGSLNPKGSRIVALQPGHNEHGRQAVECEIRFGIPKSKDQHITKWVLTEFQVRT